MSDRQVIGLDNPAFYGRLRQPSKALGAAQSSNAIESFRKIHGSGNRTRYNFELISRPAVHHARHVPPVKYFQAQLPPVTPPVNPIQIIRPAPYVQPAIAKQQGSQVLMRRSSLPPTASSRPLATPFQQSLVKPKFRLHALSKQQFALTAMAAIVFTVGMGVSLQTVLTNRSSSAQVSALSKTVDKDSATVSSTQSNAAPANVPSVVKPSSAAVAAYAVAPDLAKYIKIPKLSVSARVLQAGVTSSGALGTPTNVFDTAWYTGSSKPGLPGATLIDGHVSSWTTKGVFYGIKTLTAGDKILIIKGDNTVLTYQVVKSQVYSSANVDMQAAVTPVVAGKSGLNLITCTGQVKPGTSEFNQRVLVFAVQI